MKYKRCIFYFLQNIIGKKNFKFVNIFQDIFTKCFTLAVLILIFLILILRKSSAYAFRRNYNQIYFNIKYILKYF